MHFPALDPSKRRFLLRGALSCPRGIRAPSGVAQAKINFEGDLASHRHRVASIATEPHMKKPEVKKPKGDLRPMPAGRFQGGENGKIITPGDPAKSEFHSRTMLPEDDDDFMPPRHRWTAGEKTRRQWITEGADFGGWGREGRTVLR